MEELIGIGNPGIVDQTFAPDYVAHAGDKKYKGHAFLKGFAKKLCAAVPNRGRVEIKLLAREDNAIVWQRILRGTTKVRQNGILLREKR